MYRLLFFLLLVQLSTSLCGQGTEISSNNKAKHLMRLLTNEEDSTTHQLQIDIEEALAAGDTLAAIESLNILSSVYCNRVKYDRSYDGYWRALLLADQIQDLRVSAVSYNGLAILYSLYERRDEALKYYLRSLAINRDLVSSGQLDSVILGDNYYPLAVHYKYEKQPKIAHLYLDSCQMTKQHTPNNNHYVATERAHLYVQEGRYTEAAALFEKTAPMIISRAPEFTPIFYSHWGDLYNRLGQREQCAQAYETAIQQALLHKSHLNFVPDVYVKLAELMRDWGKPKQANAYLTLASQLNEYLYSSRSPNNKYLLEIKDEYRLEKERGELHAKEQRLLALEQAHEISRLKIFVLVLSIGLLLSAGFFVFKYWRAKHKAEKKELEREKKMEAEKSNEILSVKNKELTLSTLQLIAKDELLSDLKAGLTKIHQQTTSKEASKLIKEIGLNKDQSWLEFEKRFAAVNNDFYTQLKDRFPDLTPYDHKICALLKLDFTGKEMATLLGISAESAQTSRYRLRKKLGLSKEENLVGFIKEI